MNNGMERHCVLICDAVNEVEQSQVVTVVVDTNAQANRVTVITDIELQLAGSILIMSAHDILCSELNQSERNALIKMASRMAMDIIAKRGAGDK